MNVPFVSRDLRLGSDFERACAAIGLRSAARDHDRELPFEAVDQLKALRFGSIRLRREDGGAGVSLRTVLEALHVLAAADSNVAHIWRNHFMLAERLCLYEPANPVLQKLRHAVAGGALIGLAGAEAVRTQVGGASAASSPVVPDGADFRFSARKVYSTGSIFADWIVTYGELPDGTRVNLVIPRERPGLTLLDDWDGMGQRLTGTGTTLFEDVHVHADEVIRPEAFRPNLSFFSSTIAQIVLTTVVAGIVEAIARDARGILGQRDASFYFAPASQPQQDPLLLAALGELSAAAFATHATVMAAADSLDIAALAIASGNSLPAVEAAAIAAAKAKVVVDALAQTAGSRLFDVAGASATRRSLNLDRHWRNLRTVISHNPASYKALAIGAHELNGTPVPAAGFF